MITFIRMNHLKSFFKAKSDKTLCNHGADSKLCLIHFSNLKHNEIFFIFIISI